jgi:hypothetical protein
MALIHTNVTVGTTATLLVTIPNGVGYVAVQIGNRDTAAIYLGDSAVGVTAASGNAGQALAAAANAQIWMHGNDSLYAVSSAGTAANAVSVIYSA